jgi:hypothetical protein
LVGRLRRRFVEDAAEGFRARAYDQVAASYLGERPMPTGRLDLDEVMRHYVTTAEVAVGNESSESTLNHWLARGHAARGDTRVRLLTSVDDWTNDPDAWATLPEWLKGDDHTLILESAGHAGVVSREWFRRIILESMRD